MLILYWRACHPLNLANSGWYSLYARQFFLTMALVKTDNTILELRGRFGGVYFKKDSAGQHIQAMPRTVRYTRTGIQGKGVAGFSMIAGLWALALVLAFIPAWIMFAFVFTWLTASGVYITLTCWNWFVHYNQYRALMDYNPYWAPPRSPTDLPDRVCMTEHTLPFTTPPPFGPYDCTAYYQYAGIYNDKGFWESYDKNWYIWYKDEHYYISPLLGVEVARWS